MASPGIPIDDRTVGDEAAPYVIAELSGNHNGSLDRALAIVDAVAEAGASAVKLQTYTADTLTIDSDGPAFRVASDHGLWGGRTLHDLYDEAHTPWAWHAPILARAVERGLTCFSTPFDPTAVAFLEDLGVPAYKTASAELIDLPLLREIGRTGKPVFMSTGMATLAEIDAGLTALVDAGSGPVVILACTAAYPAPAREARLRSIPTLRAAFGVPVGLSDHTPGIGVSVAAVALGAVAVEKHVTLARADGGVDAAFSLEPAELSALVRECRAAREAVSDARFGPTEAEATVVRLRRSLWVVADVAAGERVSAANVRSIRPAGGLAPQDLATVLGRTFTRDVPRGTPLSWDVI